MALSLDTFNKLSVENVSWTTFNEALDKATPHVTCWGAYMVTDDVSWDDLTNKVCSLFSEHKARIKENQEQKVSWTLQDRIAGFTTIDKLQQLESQLQEAAKVANLFTRVLMFLRAVWFVWNDPGCGVYTPWFNLLLNDSYQDSLCLYRPEDFSRQFHFYFKALNPVTRDYVRVNDDGCVRVTEEVLRDPLWLIPDNNMITLIDGSHVSREAFERTYYKLKSLLESGALVVQFNQKMAEIEQSKLRLKQKAHFSGSEGKGGGMAAPSILTRVFDFLWFGNRASVPNPSPESPIRTGTLTFERLSLEAQELVPYRPFQLEDLWNMQVEEGEAPCGLLRWLAGDPPLEIQTGTISHGRLQLDLGLTRKIIGNCFSKGKDLNLVEYTPPVPAYNV